MVHVPKLALEDLVVLFDYYTKDDFFLNLFLLRTGFHGTRPVSFRPLFPPITHCRSMRLFRLRCSTCTNRRKLDIIRCHSEVKDSKAFYVLLIFGWLNNAVNSRLIKVAWEQLHHIPRVHHLKEPYEWSLTGRSSKTMGLTKAFSICLIYRHTPSGERIWSPEMGWLHNIVILPISSNDSIQCGGGRFFFSEAHTSVTFEPNIFRLQFFFRRPRIATFREIKNE